MTIKLTVRLPGGALSVDKYPIGENEREVIRVDVTQPGAVFLEIEREDEQPASGRFTVRGANDGKQGV